MLVLVGEIQVVIMPGRVHMLVLVGEVQEEFTCLCW